MRRSSCMKNGWYKYDFEWTLIQKYGYLKVCKCCLLSRRGAARYFVVAVDLWTTKKHFNSRMMKRLEILQVFTNKPSKWNKREHKLYYDTLKRNM